MTRRTVLALGSIGIAGAAAVAQRLRTGDADTAALRLNARGRDEHGEAVEEAVDWKAAETAIILCDMWDDHYCLNAVTRLEAMIPLMNDVTRSARAAGVHIVHAPSATMEFYDGTPQRERMTAAPHVEPPVPIARWCYFDPETEQAWPIEDEESPCDDEVVRERVRFYNRQHAALEIFEQDGVSDDGQEIFNYFEQQGVRNVVLMGVHTNKCVLGRPFGIRQMVRLGKNVVLARDLTDTMYDPRDEPHVSHEEGTRLVIEHIERYWCPSILGRDLAAAAVS